MKLKVTVFILLAFSLIVFLSTLGMLYANQYRPSSPWSYSLEDDLSRDEQMRLAYQRFLHAPQDEQDDIILELALEIQSMKWNLFSDDELLTTFDQWWISRLQNVEISYRTGYGMMGNRLSHCSSWIDRDYSYAWYYVHSTLDQQHEMDLQWIHMIHDIDTTKPLEDIQAIIDDFLSSWV